MVICFESLYVTQKFSRETPNKQVVTAAGKKPEYLVNLPPVLNLINFWPGKSRRQGSNAAQVPVLSPLRPLQPRPRRRRRRRREERLHHRRQEGLQRVRGKVRNVLFKSGNEPEIFWRSFIFSLDGSTLDTLDHSATAPPQLTYFLS